MVHEPAPTSPLSAAALVPGESASAARVATPVLESPLAVAPAASEVRASVFGVVRDESGAPFEGFQLTLIEARRSGQRRTSFVARTDSEGAFRFEPAPAGRWNLLGSGGVCDFPSRELELGQEDIELELHVRRAHPLCVRARWAEGTPVRAMSVTWRELLSDGSTGRGGGGAGSVGDEPSMDCFTLGGFCAGEYELRVESREPTRPGVATVRVRMPGPSSVDLVLDEQLVELRGRVVDLARRPIAGASVRFSPDVAAPVSPTATTAEDGSFRLAGLEPGPGMLLVLADQHVSAEFGAPRGGAFELTFGMEPLELVLESKVSVRGFVVDALGRPVAGAQVLGGGVSRPVRCDAEGRFELFAEPGKRVLYAHAKGHATSATLELELVSGQPREGVRLELRAACRVVGRVLDPVGQPTANAFVFAGSRGSLAVGPAGEFELEGLPPEPVWVQVNDNDGGFTRTQVTPRVGQETTLELKLPARHEVALELALTRDGAPLAGTVRLVAPNFMRAESTQGDAGVVTLVLQTDGRWHGVLELSNAAPEDLAARRLFELDVPRRASFSATLEWSQLRAPATADELAGWFTP